MSETHALTDTALRLPLALLPTTVLPGTTVTLGLDDSAVRAGEPSHPAAGSRAGRSRVAGPRALASSFAGVVGRGS